MTRPGKVGFGLPLLALLLVAAPAPVSADWIDFVGVGRNLVVTVDGLRSGKVVAGEINWVWAGEPPEGFSSSFYSYCLDIATYLEDPQDVVVRSTDDILPSGVGEKVAWLVNTYAPSIRQSGTRTQAAALQVAIWETLYDPVPNSLSTGDFILVTVGDIFAQAETYLAALGSASYAGASAAWLDAQDGGQDQVTLVPEPATLLLLGCALFPFGGRFRRPRGRRRHASPNREESM